MLWVDKHRPKSLNNLTHHVEITSQLTSLASNAQSLPHLLFYGPSGAGKKTRIMCLLKAIYGAGADRLRLDKRTFTTPTKKTIDINMICSNYHIELSPGDAGINDRYVIQEVIKEMAANRNVTSSATLTTSSNTGNTSANTTSNGVDYKIVVLVEVDKLSRQAQAALRRTMEKYSASCRLILCCNNSSKVIDPVRSRCLGIRIPAPSHDDICSTLNKVAGKEKFTLQDDLAIAIARESSRNLRRALLMLEALHVQSGTSNGTTKSIMSAETTTTIPKTDWEMYIQEVATDIISEQSPQQLLIVRDRLYELMINCIPATTIIRTLALALIKMLDDSLKFEILEAAAFYEHRIALGSKDIFHLEAFVAKFMAVYKKYLNDLFG